MEIVILVDNRQGSDTSLATEHGLSIYIATSDTKILLDVGASSKFLSNAERMGIDIADIDTLVLSHAHSDHTGGLETFLQHNSKARIYLSSHICGKHYASLRHGSPRDISIDYTILASHQQRFVPIGTDTDIIPGVTLICNIPAIYARPKANATLLADGVTDDFCHEIALFIRDGEQSALFSSCSHMGLLNTLAACHEPDISTFIGGLHLVDSDDANIFESASDIADICRIVTSRHPQLSIYTSHCTGNAAINALTQCLGSRFHTFHTGSHIIL